MMTIPLWTLVGFALWTILSLIFSVGAIRWFNILTGKVEIKYYRADVPQGSSLYQRAMRAHVNCVENLPIFIIVVFTITYLDLSGGIINVLCISVLVARIIHSFIHIFFEQTNTVTYFRFIFFFLQIVAMLCLFAIIIYHSV